MWSKKINDISHKKNNDMKKKFLVLSTVLLFAIALFAPYVSFACPEEQCRWDYGIENCAPNGGPKCIGTSSRGSSCTYFDEIT